MGSDKRKVTNTYTNNSEDVYQKEYEYITNIRQKHKDEKQTNSRLVGLALSGGGIRSATVCFGALQAFNKHKFLEKFDYLSTVSGGGFIGSFITALSHYANASDKSSILKKLEHTHGEKESELCEHLRKYSEYLAPKGIKDKFRIPGIMFSGFIVNLISILPLLLLVTIFITFFSINVIDNLSLIKINLEHKGEVFHNFSTILRSYNLALSWFVILVLSTFSFPMIKKFLPDKFINIALMNKDESSEYGSIALIILIILLLIESQASILFLFDQYLWKTQAQPIIYRDINSTIDLSIGDKNVNNFIITYLIIFTVILIILVSKVTSSTKQISTFIPRIIKQKVKEFLLFVIGPLTLWLLFIILSTFSLNLTFDDNNPIKYFLNDFRIFDLFNYLNNMINRIHFWPHEWHSVIEENDFQIKRNDTYVVLFLYFITSMALLFYTKLFIDINETSLHNFYREKLSQAFLLSPKDNQPKENLFKYKKNIKLTDLMDTSTLPFLLVNTTINLDRSPKFRRKAQSFFFSPLYSGSDATGYCNTFDIQKVDKKLDLGAAIAISGAAVAPIMGRMTVKPLVLLLALLNVRLGYWLPNPKLFLKDAINKLKKSKVDFRYFIVEALGLTHENRDYVFLTDGGHFDNSGIYQLLKRKCKLIVAIDGEMDIHNSFNALANILRMARIDLGIDFEINLNNLKTDKFGYSKRHFSIGIVKYSENEKALLIYLKSSLTGDENTYINTYKKSSPDFPS